MMTAVAMNGSASDLFRLAPVTHAKMESANRALLERDSQLEALDAALAEAAGGRGGTVLVEGPAGTGKTALLTAAAERAPDRGVRLLSGRGSEIEQEFAFGLARQLLEPALAELDTAARGRLMAGPARPAALAVAPERELDDASPPDGFAMLNALFLVTARLSVERPLLLCVDDAHWGDTSSLRALSYLAGRLADVPVALVVSMRGSEPGAPEVLLDQLRSEPGVAVLTPTPLGQDSVAQMVRRRLPQADDDACRAAAEVTAGNPLYLTELLRSVVDENGAGGQSDSIQRAALPSLGDRISRRVARVGESAPALAAAMAVLGDHGSLAMAGELAAVSPTAAGEIAHRLRRIEILDSEDPFVFVHPLVRRSVYDSMSTTQRDANHGSAAELLERAGAGAEVVAAHRAAVRPSGSAAAAKAMVRAATEALARGAPDEAIRWHKRALAEEAPEPPRAELLAALGTAEVALLDPAALDHLRQALEASTDPGLSGRVAVTLAPPLFASGQWTESADVIAGAQAELGSSDPALAAELAGVGLMITSYSLAVGDRMMATPERLDELTAGPSWAAHALAAMRAADAAHTGQTDRARALVDRALEGNLLVTRQDRGMWGTSHLLVALAELDEHERGMAVGLQIQELAEREGSANGRIAAISHRGWIQARQGDLAGAIAALRPQIEGAMRTGNPTFVASQLFYLQDPLLECSGLDDLVAVADALDLEDSGLAGTLMSAMVLLLRGRLGANRMDHAGAVRNLTSALAILRGLEMGPTVAPARSLLALALPADRAEEASALVAEELELAEATGLERPRGLALRAAGLLAPDKDGVAALRESVKLLDVCGARVERARSLLALGGVLRRSGARLEARDELRTAMELARTCGADLLADRAQDELRTAGGRPRRRAATGPAALTASELRVARLAADGATTPEIAQALVVSAKTVETHLTHAYAKLGLSGAGARGRLAQALGTN